MTKKILLALLTLLIAACLCLGLVLVVLAFALVRNNVMGLPVIFA